MASVPNLVVVIGTGGLGMAIARRLAGGRRLILADYSDQILDEAVASLNRDGHVVQASKDAVAIGRLDAIIYTAAVSPALSKAKQIFDIDLLGTAHVIEAFLPFVSVGTSMVYISSTAGYGVAGKISPELEEHLTNAPISELLHHKDLDLNTDPMSAYAYSKRANHLRVHQAAHAYGKKRARVNSISPGVVMTRLDQSEMDGPGGAAVKSVVERSPLGRIGTPEDIAGAVAFLVSSDASFITGTDLIVDGGQLDGGSFTAKNEYGKE